MTTVILWQHDCPGHIETEVVEGAIQVTCYVEDDGPPPVTRVVEGLRVLYTFEEGDGTVVHDVSGVGDPWDLTVESEAATSWMPDGGLSVNSPTVIASFGATSKVTDAVMSSNEITIEAWVKPANITQDGPARIVALSTDFHHRNFQLGQAADLYDVRVRTTETTDNGNPSVSAPPGSVTADLTHVAYTREALGMDRIYINGVVVAHRILGGDFSDWDDEYRLSLVNELIGSRPWLGEFHLMAIYSRALTAAEIEQNLEAGPHGSSAMAPVLNPMRTTGDR